MTGFDFAGKTVLVVGGSSGIGNGTAHNFRKAGAQVHVWGTRPTAADYADEEGSDLEGLHYACMNVSDFDAVDAYAPPFAKLDVLVLCQGTVRYRRAEFERQGWNEVMDVNVNSVMHISQKFKNNLADTKGSIIIVSSVSGFRSNIGNPAYAASKAAAVSLCKTLGAAWASDGIRVNGIAPGLVATKLTRVTTDNDRRREGTIARIPAGRLGTPDDMAGPILFLASPAASYVNGQTLMVDGGLGLA